MGIDLGQIQILLFHITMCFWILCQVWMIQNGQKDVREENPVWIWSKYDENTWWLLKFQLCVNIYMGYTALNSSVATCKYEWWHFYSMTLCFIHKSPNCNVQLINIHQFHDRSYCRIFQKFWGKINLLFISKRIFYGDS